jgi:regulator of RNase E activity RraA
MRLEDIPTTIACDILKDQALAERSARLTPMTASARMAGPVRVIEFLPARPELRRPGPPENFRAIDGMQAGEVLILAAAGDSAGAILGDMLATRARHLGAAGALVDGAVRDLVGLALAGLPVQAQAVVPMAAHQTLIPFACDRPVRFAGVTVMPGDWVLADEDGILFLTPELVRLVLDRAESAMAKDAFSRQLLLLGFALTRVFPLPEALTPHLDAFRRTGNLDADAIAATLSETAP